MKIILVSKNILRQTLTRKPQRKERLLFPPPNPSKLCSSTSRSAAWCHLAPKKRKCTIYHYIRFLNSGSQPMGPMEPLSFHIRISGSDHQLRKPQDRRTSSSEEAFLPLQVTHLGPKTAWRSWRMVVIPGKDMDIWLFDIDGYYH